MAKIITRILISLFLLTNTACAEDAKSPVSNPQGQTDEDSSFENGNSKEEKKLELMALTYKGKDPFGTDCFLYISSLEEDKNGVHHHELVVKLGYSIHGEAPLDTIVEFQRYNLNLNRYFSIDSVEPNTTPVLVSAVLDDENISVDFNKLLEYEQQGLLLQSLRADFHDIDFVSFEAALDEVLEDSTQFNTKKSDLDQLQRTILKLAHAGHYDAVACSNFNLTELKKVEFEIGGEHDGHSDSHDEHEHEH